jgi:hypothetical protein
MSLPPTASSTAVAHAQLHASIKPNTPAGKSRDYLLANPSSPDQPFGELVSRFAKGETAAQISES